MVTADTTPSSCLLDGSIDAGRPARFFSLKLSLVLANVVFDRMRGTGDGNFARPAVHEVGGVAPESVLPIPSLEEPLRVVEEYPTPSAFDGEGVRDGELPRGAPPARRRTLELSIGQGTSLRE